MQKVKHHPEGYKSYLGLDRLTSLYSVRIGWTVYASNANGTVLYKVKDNVKTPLDVANFQKEYPNIWEVLTQEIRFQRSKQLAKDLGGSHIPSPDRKKYKRSRGFTGSR
ncbi:hypothetical protein R5L37_11355 [Acinetobacter pittii]|uniref:hypothetical protein n=1 Tax=Acinetobacter pittii TaxID=48296 RepID=UPI00295390C8|nr:hypothetical protein [Acinetobacter pittii]MDV8152354.1 hypothetical protein [Acinetobacter pittii]